MPRDERVLTAFGNSEDAAVYRLDDNRALVVTIDVITPLVDDARTFGAIAATNALSDVFAMGGRALLALSFVAAPREFPIDVLSEIATGGAEAALACGCPVLGGHSVASEDLMYGLAVVGEAHPDRLFRNDGLRVGDQLVLTKPLGTGVLTTALKKGKLRVEDADDAIAGMTLSNGAAVEPLHAHGVRAVTDITGFGLVGHAAEMAEASRVEVVIEGAALPTYANARRALEKRATTRGQKTNPAYAESLGPVVGAVDPLLFDPQTSGGLLVAVDAARVDHLVAALHAAGYPRATRIGEVRAGAGVRVV